MHDEVTPDQVQSAITSFVTMLEQGCGKQGSTAEW